MSKMIEPDDTVPHCLGYTVYASVKGKEKFQPISQRYTARSAAEDFRALAVRSGFKDAYVSDVIGFEHKERKTAAKKTVQPGKEKA